ncbi:MAG: septum formation inhibitor Maf [Betaproteobacteria bacterium]|nr:septum formation inhibitor Maf [Betaproteobacteria bacterium]NBY33512.1 septum formation inhibitor Maf [Betaproteobacteria bacterium]NDF05714.1 septum formation inhibitor Maf [Betaproteobacteria bacterium]
MSALPFVYLASQSPRRQALLDQIGVAYKVLLPTDAEAAEALEAVLPQESALRYVKRVTRLKVLSALEQIQLQSLVAAPVLCADTTVVVEGHILGKPANESEAAQMLSLLSGKTHQVLTAVAIGHNQDIHLALSRSRVKFAPMTAADIQDYVASQEPMGKAGAYAIQGRASAFISHVSGSYSGIMGLPLYETSQLLKQIGAV